ncbi:ANGPT1 [Mytilus coruscus]|uniref:ANGPT1 n=1 Tax=Mytilus coruscus TaxID=42192 RepID=A0A6J7ZVX0_MYTCO|nr:ANGPT1 [Mytilus coruscus]
MYELGHQKTENEHIYDLCDLPVEHKRKDEPTKVGRNNILVIERMKICLAAVIVSFVLFCIALSVLIVVIKTRNEAKIKQQMTARFNTMENLINKSFVEKEAKIKQQMTARFNTMENLINKSFVEKARSKECADIDFIQDGIFLVYPNGENNPKHVYCVMQDNKKWTVIQRRFDFSVNFTKTWNEYKEGFGVASGEHWLGNEYIHVISTNGRHRARFILEKNWQRKVCRIL